MRTDPRYNRRNSEVRTKAAEAPDFSAVLIAGLFVIFAGLMLAAL